MGKPVKKPPVTLPTEREAPRCRAVTYSLSAFKADPTGPMAAEHLRTALKSVEEMKDAYAKKECAIQVARGMVAAIEHTDGKSRMQVAKVVGSQLTGPSTTRCELGSMLRESRKASSAAMTPHTGQPQTDGGTASFVVQLEKLLSENPRFAGLGDLMVSIGPDNGIKVSKDGKPPGARTSRMASIAAIALSIATVVLVGVLLVVRLTVQNREIASRMRVAIPAAQAAENEAGQQADARTFPAITEAPEPQKKVDEGYRITPDDESVLRAIMEAVRRKDAPLNLRQIFDVYNSVVGRHSSFQPAPNC
jgi:hypothetical protein